MKLGKSNLEDFVMDCVTLSVRDERVTILSWPVANSLEACLNNEMNVQSTVSAPLVLCNYLCCGGLIICCMHLCVCALQ